MKKLLFSLCLSLIFACNNPVETPPPPTTVNELVKQAGTLPAQPQSRLEENLGTQNEVLVENGISYSSTSTKKRISNNFDRIVAFNSAFADVLYPGSVVQGKELQQGKLSAINVATQKITLTMENSSSIEVANPSNATVTTARADLVKEAAPQPAQMIYLLKEMYSTEQAFTEIGINANWVVASIGGNFQTERSTKKNSILLFFKQIYYTISSTKPEFVSSATVEQLSPYIQQGNPPCYISSVSYGRIIMAKMTADTSYSAMRSVIEGSYSIVNGKVRFDKTKFKSNWTFEAAVIGGSAQGAANALNKGSIDALNTLIANDAVPTEGKPGFPIEYTVRYMLDGTLVPLGGSVSYTIPQWQLDKNKYQTFDLYLEKFSIIDDDEVFGSGKFGYTISISDKNDKEIETIESPDLPIEVASGNDLVVNYFFKNIVIEKTSGEQAYLNIHLLDLENGQWVDAGTQRIAISYPVVDNRYYTDLVKGGYSSRFYFRITNK